MYWMTALLIRALIALYCAIPERAETQPYMPTARGSRAIVARASRQSTTKSTAAVRMVTVSPPTRSGIMCARPSSSCSTSSWMTFLIWPVVRLVK